jgi:hypothetical protein
MDVPQWTACEDLKALAATGRVSKFGEGKATTCMIANDRPMDRLAVRPGVASGLSRTGLTTSNARCRKPVVSGRAAQRYAGRPPSCRGLGTSHGRSAARDVSGGRVWL